MSKKIIAVSLCVFMILCSLNIAVFADNDIDYKIVNPYDSVDFCTTGYYKADLHCHSTASDGSDTVKESIERHYELGFDVLGITDHGTANYSWTENHVSPVVKLGLGIKKGVKPLVSLDANGGTALNGKAYTLSEDNKGNQFYSQAGGKDMLRIPYGVENNPTSFNNAHVNSWFVDYGDGLLGGTSDYETPIAAVDALGGLSVINHPGEYTGARDEVYSDDAYNINNIKYRYVISKFENILLNNKSCLGIDINSKGDTRTRFDRILWDRLLSDLTPTDRNVFAMGSSDAHNLDIVDSGYDIILTDDFSVEGIKDSLSKGSFFAGSKYIGNVDEIMIYADGLKSNGNSVAQRLADEMGACADAINAELKENGKQDTKFVFDSSKPIARVTDIVVDNEDDSIKIETEDSYYIRWIADGKTVANGNYIDLDDYSDNLGNYIRAEIIGEGGILYTQAFMLKYENAPEYKPLSNMKDYGKIASTFADLPVNIIGIFKVVFEMILKIMNIGY